MANAILEGFYEVAFRDSTTFAQPVIPPFSKTDIVLDPLNTNVRMGVESGSQIAPIVVGPNFTAAIDTQDYLYDLYFRIWVFPLRLELRNPRTGVDIPFAVWNAFPWKNSLTSITGTGTDGIALDLEPPSQFREIEYRTVNLQILPSAPLTIEAVFDFVFQYGLGTFTLVANRASVLSIVPDVPVNEIWQWLTDVMIATDGTEQRVGLRAVPRRKLSAKLVALTEEEVYDNFKKAMFDFGGQVVIPYFQYSTSTTSDAPSGSTDISFNSARTDLREGEYVFLLAKDGQELAKIDVLGSSGATLDAPITIDLPAGSIVAPAFASVVENKSTIARYSVNDAAEIMVDSISSQARANFKRPGSTAVINEFDGYPILDVRPLADAKVQDQFDYGYERFDYQTGAIEQITRWLFTRQDGPRQYLLHRVQQPEILDWWRGFLDAARGMLNPFLLPTYRRDLFVTEKPDDAYISLTITGSDYASLFWPMAPFKRLYLWTKAGQIPVRVKSVELNDSGNTVCVLENAMPSGDDYREIEFISFLLKTRLASDEVQLEHYGLETIINLSVRTVPE